MKRKSPEPDTISFSGECCVCGILFDPFITSVSKSHTPYMFMFSFCQHHICHQCMYGLTCQQKSTLELPSINGFTRQEFNQWKKIYSVSDALKKFHFDDEDGIGYKCPLCRDFSRIIKINLFFDQKTTISTTNDYTCPNSQDCKYVSKTRNAMMEHLLKSCERCSYTCQFDKCTGSFRSAATQHNNFSGHYLESVKSHISEKHCFGHLVCMFCGHSVPIIHFDKHFQQEKLKFDKFESERKNIIEKLNYPEKATERYIEDEIHRLYKFTSELSAKLNTIYDDLHKADDEEPDTSRLDTLCAVINQ